jgi:hypothetical protein
VVFFLFEEIGIEKGCLVILKGTEQRCAVYICPFLFAVICNDVIEYLLGKVFQQIVLNKEGKIKINYTIRSNILFYF